MKNPEAVKQLGLLHRKLVASRIRERREWMGWSRERLGQELLCTATEVYYWEHGLRRPSLMRLVQIAHIFKCSLDFLGGLSNSPELSHSKKIPITLLTYPENDVFLLRDETLVDSKSENNKNPDAVTPASHHPVT